MGDVQQKEPPNHHQGTRGEKGGEGARTTTLRQEGRV